MKKQLIAKLALLAMVVAMVPVTALAAGPFYTDSMDNVPADAYGVGQDNNGIYYYTNDDDVVVVPDPDPVDSPAATPAPTPAPTPVPSAEPTPAEPVVVETIDDVKTEVNAEGQTVVTATVEVTDAAAPVAVTETAVDSLIETANEGDVVAIVAPTTGAVTVPATKLVELVEKTGNPVSVGNSVAAVAVSKELAEAANGAEVKIEPVANEDGTISVPVMAGGKEIAPEDVPGGIDVEVPVAYPASQVTGVFGVRAGMADVQLTWSVQGSGLKINLTITAAIRIVR